MQFQAFAVGCAGARNNHRTLSIRAAMHFNPAFGAEWMSSDERPTIIGLRITRTGELFQLDGNGRRWLLGSSPRCDFIINDPYVSDIHCVIERGFDGVVVVRDRGSHNGTVLDGNRIEVAKLGVGSRLVVGGTTLVAVAGVDPIILPPYLRVMKAMMEHALATKGSIRGAAKHIGMPASTFAERAKAWGLRSPRAKRE